MLEELNEQHVPVVCIEKSPSGSVMARARALKVPVFERDMRDDDALIHAGVERAKLIIIATNDDLANLEVALDARRLNPKIKTAMRQFDQAIAAKLQQSFDVGYAFSSAAVAAPIVAAKALGLFAAAPEVEAVAPGMRTVEIVVDAGSKHEGKVVAEIERMHSVKIVLARRGDDWWVNEQRLVLFHFTMLRANHGDFRPFVTRPLLEQQPLLKELLGAQCAELREAGHAESSRVAFGPAVWEPLEERWRNRKPASH